MKAKHVLKELKKWLKENDKNRKIGIHCAIDVECISNKIKELENKG
jgi:hypothetical protein